jgi:hypothetical protein
MITDGNRQEAALILSKSLGEPVLAIDISFYSWPEVFDSTAGPFGGMGGQQITVMQITAYVYGRTAVLFAEGRYWKIKHNFKFDNYL